MQLKSQNYLRELSVITMNSESCQCFLLAKIHDRYANRIYEKLQQVVVTGRTSVGFLGEQNLLFSS